MTHTQELPAVKQAKNHKTAIQGSWTLFKVFTLLLYLLILTACYTSISRSQLERKIQYHQVKRWHRWIYRGTKDEMHYLELDRKGPLCPWNFLLFPEKYKISQTELKMPRTIPYSAKDMEGIFAGGNIHRLPDIYYRQSGNRLVITEATDSGTTMTVREYQVRGDRVIPHGAWAKRRTYYETCEYDKGILDGRRFLKFWLDIGGGFASIHMDQQWKRGKPDGLWHIEGYDLRLGEVEFRDGVEIRCAEYGADRFCEKLLLREWTRGELTYRRDWVRHSPSRLLDPSFYLNPEYMPDITPRQYSLKWIKENIRMFE